MAHRLWSVLTDNLTQQNKPNMDFTYLGGGQNSQSSSIGNALSQKYAPLESMLQFSREAYDRGVAESSQTMREAMRLDAERNSAETERRYSEKQAKIKKKELQQADLQEKQFKLEDEGKRNLGFLSEWMDEQNDLIDNALMSNDPEIRATVPALVKNLLRVKGAIESEDVPTLSGRLKYNEKTSSMSPSQAVTRSKISQKIPEAPVQKEPQKQKEEKKDDGKKVPVPSSDVIDI